MNQTICQAIDECRVLELRYHGYSRIVEPHGYGLDKHGDEVLRCYQLAGGSERGERAGWKLLKLRDAVVVHVAETDFVPRPEFGGHDPVIRKMYNQVAAQPKNQ